MKPTALETLQPNVLAEALQADGVPSPESQPDSLEIAGHETVPASLKTLAETATKTAFESLAYKPAAESRGSDHWTNQQSGWDLDPIPSS